MIDGDIQSVLEETSPGCIVCGDCLEVMATMPDGSVDLIVADPPYYKVKAVAWDRQWNGGPSWRGKMHKTDGYWGKIEKSLRRSRRNARMAPP